MTRTESAMRRVLGDVFREVERTRFAPPHMPLWGFGYEFHSTESFEQKRDRVTVAELLRLGCCGVGRSKETSLESIAVIKARDDGGIEQGEGEVGEKWPDSGYIKGRGHRIC